MSALDPITLQVLVGGLRAACEEMGAALIRSAYSANIKERRDCSTALFDAAGELVMQAEHIPVHLGSMPDAVAAVLGEEQRPGSAWILNDPYRGGTHLPDITLISPVFVGGELFGFAACRAHHADVGGPTPGSMPAGSRTPRGRGRGDPADPRRHGALERARRPDALPRASGSPTCAPRRPPTGSARCAWPSSPSATALERLRAGMEEILAYAERRTRAALAELPDGAYAAEDVLEDDARRAPRRRACGSRRRSRGERLRLDFGGTDPQVEGNLNCPLSVTKSAAFFAVRVLTDPDAPPSAGAYRPIEVIAPEGCLLNARPPAAVVAGNVETSSRVADLVIAALGRRPPGPRPGPGDDEQPDPRRRGLHLLRDARRRPGRLPRRRRPERDPRRDVEHAQHPDRGARDRVPAAGPRAGAAPRQRRRRAPTAAATGSSARSKRWRRCASP